MCESNFYDFLAFILTCGLGVIGVFTLTTIYEHDKDNDQRFNCFMCLTVLFIYIVAICLPVAKIKMSYDDRCLEWELSHAKQNK